MALILSKFFGSETPFCAVFSNESVALRPLLNSAEETENGTAGNAAVL